MHDNIAYILQQLALRGIAVSLVQFLQVPLKSGVQRYELAAYNQLLFVNLRGFPGGTRIIADNNAVDNTNTSPSSLYQHMDSIEEFSGQVVVEFPYGQLSGHIEFIQVIKK